MCRSRYFWRARECACWTCSLRGLSARAVRARSWRHNPSRRRKQPAAAPCKPGACRAPPTAVLEVPVTSWTTTAGLAKRVPPNISMACVQEGQGVKVSAVRRAAGALQEAKCTRRTQGARLKYGVRVFAGGGAHLTSGPNARRQPQSLQAAPCRACPRHPRSRPPSIVMLLLSMIKGLFGYRPVSGSRSQCF